SLRRHHAAIGADIGAHVAKNLAAQAEDRAVASARDLQLAIDLARMVDGEQMLAPVLDPFHRAVDLARGKWNQKVLRIEFTAHAEAAADVEFDHINRAL